jgi:DNA-directed DNA polymerase III PolC
MGVHVFVHLHCHSHYSFLRGVGSPEELVAAALEAKMPAVALTDTNGLYGAVAFYKAALSAGVKPIVGVTLDVAFRDSENEIRKTKFESRNAKYEMRNANGVTLTLLAMDMEGYSNLCELATLRHLGTTKLGEKKNGDGQEGRAVFVEELAERSRGLIAICPLPVGTCGASGQKGTMYRAPTREKANGEEALEWIAGLKAIFGERLWIEVQHLSAGEGRKLREAERVGRELGVPLVATNNVHFLKAEEHVHHRVVNAIRTGGLLTTVAAPEITTGEAWFKPAEEMRRVFPDHPELLNATLEIAERCNLKLELGKLILPEFEVPEGNTADSYLAKLSLQGAIKRYGYLKPEVRARLIHELKVIHRWKLAPYFLLVWDIVNEAARRGIPAIARGSAASSMVAYCLGISCVCPLRWGLYFERFLNEQRGDCPDIDIDICGARRDELLDYVYEHWGKEHVAMIGSFITMHARLAVREVAKVFGVPPGEVNRFTKRLPHRPVREIMKAIRELPECRDLPVEEEPWKTILHVALRLDDAPRHMGIHPCGTVISARPLNRLAPLERATKGIVVTQYEMNAIEALGLVKMDLLGQRGFTTMSLALDNIEEAKESEKTEEKSTVAPDGMTPRPKARVLNFDAIPENDAATCEVIAAGRTMGIFQIESPAMRGLLQTMRARTLEEIAQALALIRPGASEYGSKELFVKRLRGEEKVTYAHPALEKILGDSLGVCIFQEQVMQISQAMGNMSLAEADIVRRTSAKYAGKGDRDRLRGKFLKAAELMGLNAEQREETWMMVEKFAGFGFCKAHAATYADISYRMAYLKTHHPAEFLAAMCSAGAGFYHVSAYVEEAKRWGIEIRLPSVNHSRMEYTAESGENGKRALRIGLMQVKGLRIETIGGILRSREEKGAFHSLDDFLQRIAVEVDEIESLIKCGAFDDVCGMTRPEMLWRWNLLQAAEKKARTEMTVTVKPSSTLFAETSAEEAIGTALAGMPTAEYTLEQKLRYERSVLEVCVSGHPLDFLPRNGEAWSDELPKLRGKRVTLCGWVVTYRHVGTKNYRNMMFVTLEDQRGVYEVVMFPDAYDRYGSVVFESRTLRVTGRVEMDGQINCEMLMALKAVKQSKIHLLPGSGE